jgi:chromosome segregation ATPase
MTASDRDREDEICTRETGNRANYMPGAGETEGEFLLRLLDAERIETAWLKQARNDLADRAHDAEARIANLEGQIERLRAELVKAAGEAVGWEELAKRRLSGLQHERTRVAALEKALRQIADPVGHLRREAEAQGARLNGAMIPHVVTTHYLSEIARAALAPSPQEPQAGRTSPVTQDEMDDCYQSGTRPSQEPQEKEETHE